MVDLFMFIMTAVREFLRAYWAGAKAKSGTPSYTDTYSPIVELFRRERNGFWSLYTLGTDDSVELKSLDVDFSVAEVYQNTSFMGG